MPLYAGTRVLIKIACPRCGEVLPNYQPENSDFFLIACQNTECDSYGSEAVVEKRNGIVLSVNVWQHRDPLTGVLYRLSYGKVEESEEPKS